MKNINSKIIPVLNKDRGFILLATMVVLMFLMIIGLSTYNQTVMSARTLGMSRFKSVASVVTESVLNKIEEDILMPGEGLGMPNGECSNKDCDAITGREIDIVREKVEQARASSKEPPVRIDKFYRYDGDVKDPTGTAVAYYSISILEEGNSSVLYRTTIVNFVLDNMDVVESGFRGKKS